MSRILVIRGGAIGDFILTLPALKLLRESFPPAHLEVLGYKPIVALAEISGYINASRSIEAALLSTFFSRNGELAPALVEYFASFNQVISYLYDPDEIFADNLKRAGVRHLIAGPAKLTDREHAARQLARPLEKLALSLEDPAAVILPNEKRKVDRTLIALHPGSGSATKNWPLECWIALAQSLLSGDEQRRLLLVGGEADGARLARLRAVLPNEKIEWRKIFPCPRWLDVCKTARSFWGTTAASRISQRPSEHHRSCFSVRLIRRSGRQQTET